MVKNVRRRYDLEVKKLMDNEKQKIYKALLSMLLFVIGLIFVIVYLWCDIKWALDVGIVVILAWATYMLVEAWT